MPSGGLRVLVVDDEPLARQTLRVLLAGDVEVDSVREASNGPDAVDLVRRERPDILFLDVQMPQMGGFEVVHQLCEAERPAIVFVTAHNDQAVRAFEVAAVDYLLKPFDDRRFALALERAKERVRAARLEEAAHTLNSLVGGHSLPAPTRTDAPSPRERLVAKSVGRAVFIDVRDIEYMEAEDYYVLVHARGESHLVRESMRDLEQRLPRGFVRIHRSTLVNAAFVAELVTDDDGEHVVVLRGGARLHASRGKRERLLELLAHG
ncbi:MAG: LytR/AlgR family response regulator transcription factor [Polyangiaceae bacterium]